MSSYDLPDLIGEILDSIPLARAMALAGVSHDAEGLRLRLPLAPNVNDKGCAFGGSLASGLTLTGWGLVRLAVARAGQPADIYIQDQQLRYLAPAWADIELHGGWPEPDSASVFLDQLGRHGKARISLEVSASSAGQLCSTMTARFVALRK